MKELPYDERGTCSCIGPTVVTGADSDAAAMMHTTHGEKFITSHFSVLTLTCVLNKRATETKFKSATKKHCEM